MSGVVSYLDLRDPIFLGKGGGTFVLVGLASTDGPVESLVPKLHERAIALQNQLRGRYPAVKLELTGEIPLNFDIRKASADDVQRGESLVIPATLALLLVAFGSLVAALIPLAVGQLAIATTLAITGFLAHALALVHSGSESGHHAWAGLGNRLRAPHGQPLPGSDCRRARRARRLSHRGTSGGSHALDFRLDGSHRISRPLDGSHQRNPFHRCRGISGGRNECVADQYPCSGSAGLARSAD